MIAVVDYGMGNLRSISKALEKVGLRVVVTSDPSVINDSRGMVLPGVGAFSDCMKNLDARRLINPVIDFVESKRPFFGICLGLQLLFSESFEFGRHEGLGVIPGQVVRFEGEAFRGEGRLKVPHMGWNRVSWKGLKGEKGEKEDITLFNVSGNGDYFYFVHSYYVVPEDDKCIAGITEYGSDFVSAVKVGNVFATQFHPEKSQSKGLAILKSFGELVEKWES